MTSSPSMKRDDSSSIISKLRSSSSGSLSANAPGARKSFKLGGSCPWEVNGTYRVLQPLFIRQELALSSPELGRVSAGSLVTVKEIHNTECSKQGWCPCALILVHDGAERGQNGWIRCIAATDGHDLLDTRDQNEYEKVIEKLRSTSGDRQQASKQVSNQKDGNGTSAPIAAADSLKGPKKEKGKQGKQKPKPSAEGEGATVVPDEKLGAARSHNAGCMSGCMAFAGTPCSRRTAL